MEEKEGKTLFVAFENRSQAFHYHWEFASSENKWNNFFVSASSKAVSHVDQRAMTLWN